MGKIIKKTILGIVIAFDLWFLLSYVDVVLHNLTTQTYAFWNLFTLCV